MSPSVEDIRHEAVLQDVERIVAGLGGLVYRLGLETSSNDIEPVKRSDDEAAHIVRTRSDVIAILPEDRAVLIDAKTTGRRYRHGDFLIELRPFLHALFCTQVHKALFLFACQWGDNQFGIHDLVGAASQVDAVMFPSYRHSDKEINSWRIRAQQFLPNALFRSCDVNGDGSGDPFVRFPASYCDTLKHYGAFLTTLAGHTLEED